MLWKVNKVLIETAYSSRCKPWCLVLGGDNKGFSYVKEISMSMAVGADLNRSWSICQFWEDFKGPTKLCLIFCPFFCPGCFEWTQNKSHGMSATRLMRLSSVYFLLIFGQRLHKWQIESASSFSSLLLASSSFFIFNFLHIPFLCLLPPTLPDSLPCLIFSTSLDTSDIYFFAQRSIPSDVWLYCTVAVATCDVGHSVQPHVLFVWVFVWARETAEESEIERQWNTVVYLFTFA